MAFFGSKTNRYSGLGRVKCFLPGVLGIFMLAACQNSLVRLQIVAGNSFDIGANQVGEACRVAPSPDSPASTGGRSSFEVYCGNWEEPSAKIFIVKAEVPPSETAARGWWRNRLETVGSCGSPVETTILEGVPAAAVDCKLRPGGWPYQALAVDIDANSYLVESIPSAYPAAERAIGALSGKTAKSRATEMGPPSGETKRLAPVLASARYSAGDLKAYRDLLWRGQYYNFLGNYAEAEKKYNQAAELDQKMAPGGLGDQCFVSMHIALELSNQGRFNLADAMFQKARALLNKSTEPDIDEARLTGYEAVHQANMGKKEEGLNLARKATSIRRELARQYGYSGGSGPGGTHLRVFGQQSGGLPADMVSGPSERAATVFGDLIQSLTLEAAMQINIGKHDQAERSIEEAETVLSKERRLPRRWLCQVMLLQARIAETRNNWQRAESLLKSAIDIQRSLYTDSRNEGLALSELGRVYAAQGRNDRAIDAYTRGFDIINKAQCPISIDDASPFFDVCLAEVKDFPDRKQKLFEEMFEVSQMVRGSIIAETMALTVARLSAGNDETGMAIRELQDGLYARDQAREALTLAQADPRALSVQIGALEKKYAELNAKVEGSESRIKKVAPTYNQLLDRKVSTRDTIAALRHGEALSRILVGKKATYAFFVDADGIIAYSTDLSENSAEELVARLRRAVEPTTQLPTFPVGDAYTLYQKLFGPVKDRLSRVEHLIYVPSGPLLSLPFGVLPVEPPEVFSRTYYSEIEWMTLHRALTMGPSVQSFVNLRSKVRPAGEQSHFIGFGDFAPLREDPDTFLRALNLPDSCRDEADLFIKATWNKLPNSAIELRTVAGELGAPENSLVMDNSFTEEAVLKTKLDHYRIVYFSTHGLLPSRLRCFSEPALVVSKGTGLLNASTIAGLKMNADMVVLSACDSGGPAGKTGGEALSGLARSFFYAGARSMVVSHWELLDKPSVELLTTMFRDLASENISFAEALRKGQTVLIKNAATSHPMIWGALCLVGDGGERLGGGK